MKRCLLVVVVCFCFLLGLSAQGGRMQRLSWEDPHRQNRKVSFELHYPQELKGSWGDSLRLIVLGHGFVMNPSVYANWWGYFLPRGYVFALPSTEQQAFPAPNHLSFGEDMYFLLDSLCRAARDDVNSPFYGHLAWGGILMGHSMGGGAAFLGGAGDKPALRGLIGLAPALTQPSAIEAAKKLEVPCLILAGQADRVTPAKQHQLPIFEALNPRISADYFALEEGSHCYFANYHALCNFGESQPGRCSREEQQAWSHALVEAWLDRLFRAERPETQENWGRILEKKQGQEHRQKGP